MEACIIYNEHSITDPTIKDIINIKDLDLISKTYDRLFIGDLLNFLEQNEIVPIMTKLRGKLTPQGKLEIEQFDLFELCSAYTENKLSVNEFNNVLRPRKELYSLIDTFDILSKLNLKINKKDIDNYKFHIEVQHG